MKLTTRIALVCLVAISMGSSFACRSDARAASPAKPYAAWKNPEFSMGTTVQFTAPKTLLGADGLRLDEQMWRFDDETGFAWRVRLELGSAAASVIASDDLVKVTEFEPDGSEAFAAINGGFYDGFDSPTPLGLVVSEGTVHTALTSRGGSGVFQVTDEGPQVIHRTKWTPGPAEALQSVDRLVESGASLVKSRRAHRDARSAVVVGERFLWLVVVAGEKSARRAEDGVHLVDTTKHGMPLYAFADYLVESTDAVTALNLDGAVSSQLSVGTGDRRFRAHGERGTLNAIVTYIR